MFPICDIDTVVLRTRYVKAPPAASDAKSGQSSTKQGAGDGPKAYGQNDLYNAHVLQNVGGVRHMVLFVAGEHSKMKPMMMGQNKAEDDHDNDAAAIITFPFGFAKDKTPVRRFGVACRSNEPNSHIICTLIEEAKTQTHWIFYVHTSRIVKTEWVCKALLAVNLIQYPTLQGTFFVDETRYNNVKRHSFTRMQHFRFFAMQILADASESSA
jgi:hypothetical protein